MAKRNQKHEKRVKKLIVICMLSAIILTVSTYAWFIGMQTVSVNAFEVKIAAADGLSLSVTGDKGSFSDNVTINADELENIAEVYKNHTNKWTDLEPISTVGKMNSDYSRMIIYEKSSLTASAGGYRLLSEVLNNTTRTDEKEADGYVVFDLFVKNLSGEAYYTTNDVGNEEGIYLTVDSNVSVSNSGVKDTGIENSVRVAFAQIGRVKSDSETATIQGITCSDTTKSGSEEKEVTGICRQATIWEPNDTKHVANAISWYNKSCAKRTAGSTYGEKGTCKTLTDGNAYDTYAVNKVITENEKDANRDYEVDIYDGLYNEYTTSTGAEGYLYNVNTFTDSEKIKTGSSRQEFMTLAPNSITKVRVYVYIEGQDVDNYDFASLGKQITVNFGFTKERFYAEDFDYDNNPDAYGENEQLYRNYRVTYEASAEDAVKELPENVDSEGNDITYNYSTKTLTIPRTVRSAFSFKDGDTTVTFEPTIAADGTIDWAKKTA